MDCINAGITAANAGVTSATFTKQSSNFSRYSRYLQKCNLTDTFLDSYSTGQRNLILSGFGHHVRANIDGKTNRDTLAGSTVAAAISDVVQTFRQNLRPDPSRDESGTKSAIITRQLKNYTNQDPPKQSQQCLPILVWERLLMDQSSPLTEAMGHLACGALFFAMRSCEYSSPNKSDGLCKTKILCVENFCFFQEQPNGMHIEIAHSSPLPILQSADCITITFINQKNGEKEASITQHKSGHKLCPVKIWAANVKRVLAYPNTSPSSQINSFWDHKKNKLLLISSKQIRQHIKRTVLDIGTNRLGVDIKRIGTHSIRTSCAMLLYLQGVRTSTIMLLGRWQSDAFLLYLRRNIREFTTGVSSMMMTNRQSFFNIPEDSNPQHIPQIHSTHDDPMTSNLNSSTSQQRFNGLLRNANYQSHNIAQTSFHTWG